MNEFNYFPQLINQSFHHQQQQPLQNDGQQQTRYSRRGYYN